MVSKGFETDVLVVKVSWWVRHFSTMVLAKTGVLTRRDRTSLSLFMHRLLWVDYRMSSRRRLSGGGGPSSGTSRTRISAVPGARVKDVT